MSNLVLLNEVQDTAFFDCIGVCPFLCCLLKDIPNWINLCYFLISSSIKNNLIYLFITSSQTWLYKKRFFVVVESSSMFCSSKIKILAVYSQVDYFTGYSRIIIEH